jgi:predicted transcriptional regulator
VRFFAFNSTSYKTQLLNLVQLFLNIANTDLFDFIEYKCASSNVLKDTTRQTLYLYFGDSPKGSLLENELNMTDAVPA